MKNIDIICEDYPDESFLQADGFDDALLGVVSDFNAELRLAYSKAKCITILVERDGMTDEEALEHFDYNVQGAYVGEKTPVWIDDLMLEEWGSKE